MQGLGNEYCPRLEERAMVQESLVYGFVARGTTVLAEHPEVAGDIPTVAVQCLHKLAASSGNKFTYKVDQHVYSFLLEDGCAYCVVSNKTVGKELPTALLERIQEDFRKQYGSNKADTTADNYCLNKEFGPLLKEHIKYVNDHASRIDEDVMLEKIEKAIARSANICALSGKADRLGLYPAQTFRMQGIQLRRKMWYQNLKIKFVVIGVIILLALIILFSIWHGVGCNNQNHVSDLFLPL